MFSHKVTNLFLRLTFVMKRPLNITVKKGPYSLHLNIKKRTFAYNFPQFTH